MRLCRQNPQRNEIDCIAYYQVKDKEPQLTAKGR